MSITAEKLYDLLSSTDFDDWYQGKFMDHVVGEDGSATKNDILEDIEELLIENICII